MGGELVSTRSRVWDHLSGKVRGVRAAGDMYPDTFFWVGHVSSMTSFLSSPRPFFGFTPLSGGPKLAGCGATPGEK